MFSPHIESLLDININPSTAVLEAVKLELAGDSDQAIRLVNEVLYNKKWNPVLGQSDKLTLSILAPITAANFNATIPEDHDFWYSYLSRAIKLEVVYQDPDAALLYFKNELSPVLAKAVDDDSMWGLFSYSDVILNFCPVLYKTLLMFPCRGYSLISSYNRRSLEVRGNVNFPVYGTQYISSNEGGLFVRLVVEDPTYSYMVCSGGYNSISMDENFIGDDKPCWCQLCRTGEYTIECHNCSKFNETFPNYDLPREESEKSNYLESLRYESIPYLAVLTLGSTGWSGYDQDAGEMWTCTYDDLTDSGKALYDSLALAYPEAKLVLQTWLDT